ncbi:MAG: SMP-30/gluconolactonase/LRE family protein, partial [Paracoccaceae bacterium]
QRAMPGRPGFVGLHASGGLVLGIEREIVLFNPDTDKGTHLSAVEADGVRINDGSCDHAGRLWFGTMDDAVVAPSGALFRLGAAGPEVAVNRVIASNGPAFATDRRSIFHCDTLGRRILRYALQPDGALGIGSIFRSFAPNEGLPDGMACDTGGGLWVALWGGGSVVRLDKDGGLSARIAVPSAQVTACAFGGPDLDTLFITTATLGLTAAALAGAPDSGGLFMCHPGWTGKAPTPMLDLLPPPGEKFEP